MLKLPWPVVLASSSPRRKALLRQLVKEFAVVAADLDEDAMTVANPWQNAQALAVAKAAAVAKLRPDALVIAGDTVVALPNDDDPARWDQLAKPADALNAEAMLRRLSGRTHAVITGLALAWPAGSTMRVEATWVRFRPLSEIEIQAYAASGEPLDKAGGYAIQGGAEGFVASIEGSLSNVVGLPLEALEQELKRLGSAG